jgi:hypothetical protein
MRYHSHSTPSQSNLPLVVLTFTQYSSTQYPLSHSTSSTQNPPSHNTHQQSTLCHKVLIHTVFSVTSHWHSHTQTRSTLPQSTLSQSSRPYSTHSHGNLIPICVATRMSLQCERVRKREGIRTVLYWPPIAYNIP